MSTCRRMGCNRPARTLSIFCDEHHDEQLARFGSVRVTPSSRAALYWELYGDREERSAVEAFLDLVDVDNVEALFAQLCPEYQNAIKRFLVETPVESLRTILTGGGHGGGYNHELTQRKRACANRLKDFVGIPRLSTSPSELVAWRWKQHLKHGWSANNAAQAFFDEVDVNDVEAVFFQQVAEFQAAIRAYLLETPIGTMRHYRGEFWNRDNTDPWNRLTQNCARKLRAVLDLPDS